MYMIRAWIISGGILPYAQSVRSTLYPVSCHERVGGLMHGGEMTDRNLPTEAVICCPDFNDSWIAWIP